MHVCKCMYRLTKYILRYLYRIEGIIRGDQFSREEELFVLRGLFPLWLASGPYSPRYDSRVYFSRVKLNRE